MNGPRGSRQDTKDQLISPDTQQAKKAQILDCALNLLIETGDSGLTMRKLAECAGMRLSNVQYYFKSRDDVLAAMVARYFNECAENLLKITEESSAQTPRTRIKFLVEAGLSHGHEISDMCRAFREIWAISSRNSIIDECLIGYYQRFADVMTDYVFGGDVDTKPRERFMTLLVPYFEGYSVTARAMPLREDAVVEMLVETVLQLLDASKGK